MKAHLLILLLCLPFLYVDAQQEESSIKFRGGMMLHLGFLKNTRTVDGIDGVCYGIGGQLSFAVGNRCRLGTEGYASNINYRKQDGYYKLGWGGLLFGYQIGNKKLHPVIGITLGGGKVKDLLILEGNTSDDETDQVIYRKYPVMLASPSISVEYSIKSKLTFVTKLDYLIPLFSSNYSDYAYGPRLYLGILFNRY